MTEHDGLEMIRKLRPVRYVWDRSKEAAAAGDQLGFIAQEVQKLYPEVVGTGPDEEITRASSGKKETIKKALAVRYSDLIAPVVKALQQLDAIVTELRKALSSLTGRVDAHDAEIKALKAENAELKTRLDAMERKLEAVPAKP